MHLKTDTDVNAGAPSSSEIANISAVNEPPASSDVGSSTPVADVTSSPSSSENAGPAKETRADLLSVIKDAAEGYGKTPDTAQATSPETPNGADPGQTQDTASTGDDANDTGDQPDLSADEVARLAPKAQKRFRELVKQNKELTAQLDQYRPAIEGYDQLNTFLSSNRLSVDDANLTLEVGAMLRRGDFRGFLQVVEPYVLAAKEALGDHIPSDLRQQVDDGLIPEDTARELVRRRSETQRLQASLAETQQEAQQFAQAQRANGIRSIVSSWERQVQQTDPDYALKQDAIRDFARAVVQERGVPRTPQEALGHAQEAYRRATELVTRLRPASRPTQQAPSSAQTQSNAVPAPKTLQEAMALGLRRAAGN